MSIIHLTKSTVTKYGLDSCFGTKHRTYFPEAINTVYFLEIQIRAFLRVQKQITHHLCIVVHGRWGHTKGNWKKYNGTVILCNRRLCFYFYLKQQLGSQTKDNKEIKWYNYYAIEALCVFCVFLIILCVSLEVIHRGPLFFINSRHF